MMLRFLPYIGPVIAAMLPFAVAVAESDGWRTPLSVLALFVVTEAMVGNIVEPMLYGVHTGLLGGGAAGFSGVLDGDLGTGGAGAFDAAHRLPERARQAFVPVRVPERGAGR